MATLSQKFKPVSSTGAGRIRQQNPKPPSTDVFAGADDLGDDIGGGLILQYPSDIGSNPRYANYILFTSYSLQPANIKKQKAKQAAFADELSAIADPEVPISEEERKKAKAKVDAKFAFENARSAGARTSLLLNKQNFAKSNKTIALYMPASVNAKYNMDFQESEIGFVSDAIYSIIKNIQAGSSVGDALKEAGGTAGSGLINMGLNVLNAAVPGVKDLVAIERGTVIAPRMEVMFQGIGKRNFEFQFTFMPKSLTETYEIYDIIKEFKRAMTPNFKMNGSVRELSFPDMFQIDYMHQGEQNTFINKIGRCYLESADVTYGGDRFITFDAVQSGAADDPRGAPPAKVVLSLSFKEIETMDRARIAQGF